MKFQSDFPIFIHSQMVLEILESLPQNKKILDMIENIKLYNIQKKNYLLETLNRKVNSKLYTVDSFYGEELCQKLNMIGYLTGKELLKVLKIKNLKQFLIDLIKNHFVPNLNERKTNIEVAKIMDYQEIEIEKIISKYTEGIVENKEEKSKENIMKCIVDNLQFMGYEIIYYINENNIIHGYYKKRNIKVDYCEFFIIIKFENEKITEQDKEILKTQRRNDSNIVVGIIKDPIEGLKLLIKEFYYDFDKDKLISKEQKIDKVKRLSEIDIKEEIEELKKERYNSLKSLLEKYEVETKNDYVKIQKRPSKYEILKTETQTIKDIEEDILNNKPTLKNDIIDIKEKRIKLINDIIDKIERIKGAHIYVDEITKEKGVYVEKDYSNMYESFSGNVLYVKEDLDVSNRIIKFWLLMNFDEYNMSYEELNEKLKIQKEMGYKIGMIKNVDEALDIIFGEEVLNLEFKMTIE